MPEKKRYAVQFLATASHTVYVDAENAQEAADKADEDFAGPQVCHQCARVVDLSDWEPDDTSNGVWEVES